ncbi:hypothetical protein [Phyllobacterium sp. K27]
MPLAVVPWLCRIITDPHFVAITGEDYQPTWPWLRPASVIEWQKEFNLIRPHDTSSHEIAYMEMSLKPVGNRLVASDESHCAGSIRATINSRSNGRCTIRKSNDQSLVLFAKQWAGVYARIYDPLIIIGGSKPN